MTRRLSFDDLVANLYEAVSSGGEFLEPLRLICSWSDVRHAGVVSYDATRPGSLLFSENTLRDSGYPKKYWSTYVHHSPLLAPSRDVPVGRVMTDSDLVDRRLFEKSAFYNEFLRYYDIGYVMATWLARDDHANTVLLTYRAPSDEGFSDRERAAFSQVARHVERALRLRAMAGGRNPATAALLDSLESLSAGGVLLDGAGKVVEMNGSATAIVSARAGLSLSFGRLACAHPDDDRALSQMLGRLQGPAAAGAHGGELTVRGPAGRSLALQLFAIPGSDFANGVPRAAALAVIRDAGPRGLPAEQVWAARGLTPAERRIAERLARGETPREICEALCVSGNTLKTHRARIYAKLGVDSQAKLASLARRHPAG